MDVTNTKIAALIDEAVRENPNIDISDWAKFEFSFSVKRVDGGNIRVANVVLSLGEK